jgi:hypothetical protein
MFGWVNIYKVFIGHFVCRWRLVTCLCWQHVRRCEWETLECREEFLDEAWRKGAKLGKRMVHEKRKKCVKNIWSSPRVGFLIQLREWNLSDTIENPSLDELHDHQDITLAYWRQNHGQYPPEQVWGIFRLDLLNKSFKTKHELWAWCVTRVKQLKDPMYCEEQRKQQKKIKEERLAWKVEQ